MPSYADRVQETTVSTGTTTVTLGGAAVCKQSFANKFADQTKVHYTIQDNASLWEVGQGTFTLAGTLLSRDVVLDGSSGPGTLVNFAAGSKDVFCDLPATAVAGMTKTSLASPLFVRVAEDDDMVCFQDLVLNGSADVQVYGPAELVVFG